MSRTRTLVLASVAAIALVVGGAAVGSAATSARAAGRGGSGSSDLLDPAAFETALGAWTGDGRRPGAAPGAQDRRDRFRHRAAGRMLHGEIVLQGRDDAPVTMAFQNGQVTAVDATSVSVRSTDGYERTWVLDGTTRYVKSGEGRPGDARHAPDGRAKATSPTSRSARPCDWAARSPTGRRPPASWASPRRRSAGHGAAGASDEVSAVADGRRSA